MTSFAIIRTKKHKHIASIIGVARHHAREVACATADPKKSPRNQSWGAGKSPSQAVGDRVQAVIDQAQKTAGKKFRSDSVKAVEYLMTASNEWWATATKEQKTGYLKRCRSWLEKKHGEGCVVAEWLHVDERSPHLHAIVVPLYEGKLNAKHFLGGKARMRALQDDFAKVCGEPFGLSRGVAGSNADHVPVADWWAALNAPPVRPSKMDYAKAAVGIDVPAVETLQKQAKGFEVQKNTTKNLRNRAARVEERALEVESKATHVAGLEKSVKSKIDRLIQLENENIKLREELAKIKTPRPSLTLDNLQDFGL